MATTSGISTQAEQNVTPSWEPEYGPESWQALLESLGYTKRSAEAYTKEVNRP